MLILDPKLAPLIGPICTPKQHELYLFASTPFMLLIVEHTNVQTLLSSTGLSRISYPTPCLSDFMLTSLLCDMDSAWTVTEMATKKLRSTRL